MLDDTSYDRIAADLQAFCTSLGVHDVVIGLSGGLDSALVAALAVDALGSAHVHAIALPSRYTSEASYSDAHSCAQNLRISYDELSIEPAVEAFMQMCRPVCGQALEGLPAENIQARTRMVALMAVSNARGWLMLNTGNKSEGLMGYSTLYGDMAGAFAPLGDAYKSEVVALAQYRNNRSLEQGGGEIIPSSIISKPPSAELRPGQSDEESLGMNYERLDVILQHVFEEEGDPAMLLAHGYLQEEVSSVMCQVKAQAFKAAYRPPCSDLSRYRHPLRLCAE